MEKYLDNVFVVLVEPKNPGNIGSVARVMKNMGIRYLRLVNPVEYKDVDEQKKMGYRSQDIINNCQEFNTLSESLSDISCVFLATSKKGKWKRDFISPSSSAKTILQKIQKEKVALVFGREDSGITIDESQLANYFIRIPSAVDYPSLNLSHAVMVVVYEIFNQLGNMNKQIQLPKMAKKVEFERLTDNIWELMKSLEFREEDKGLFHRSLKRALNRTRWTNADIAVFDRACKQVRWYIENRGHHISKEKK